MTKGPNEFTFDNLDGSDFPRDAGADTLANIPIVETTMPDLGVVPEDEYTLPARTHSRKKRTHPLAAGLACIALASIFGIGIWLGSYISVGDNKSRPLPEVTRVLPGPTVTKHGRGRVLPQQTVTERLRSTVTARVTRTVPGSRVTVTKTAPTPTTTNTSNG